MVVHKLFLVLLLVVAWEHTAFFQETLRYEGESAVMGEQAAVNVIQLPVCMAGELLTFTDGELLCRQPAQRTCPCPPQHPLPPGGCQVFRPPARGAFVCLRLTATIFCSVVCDNNFEFSGFPLNPYYCGQSTGFIWRDYTDFIVHDLPECNGFGHRGRRFFADENYIPVACDQLNTTQSAFVIDSFFTELRRFFECPDCDKDSVFIQCP